MSEEIALAAADLATVEQLRARVLEWEDCYDRLAGAFDLHMDILECKQALSDLAGGYYDVLIGDMAAQEDYWRIQAADVLTDLHTAEAEIARLRSQNLAALKDAADVGMMNATLQTDLDAAESQLGQAHAALDAAERELIHTRTDLEMTQLQLSDAEQATAAERAARVAAEADNVKLLHLARSAVDCVRGLLYDDGTDRAVKKADRWIHGFEKELAADHPGAALLAELTAARAALEAIDRHVVGACESDFDNMPEPCEECGEMREIAAQALKAMKKARAE